MSAQENKIGLRLLPPASRAPLSSIHPSFLPCLLPSFPPQANLSRSPSSTPRDPIISRRDRAICRAIKNNSVDEGCCSWDLTRFKSKSKTYKLAADFFCSSLFFPPSSFSSRPFYTGRRRLQPAVFQLSALSVCVSHIWSLMVLRAPPHKRERKGKKQCDQHSRLYIFLPPAAVSQSNESSGISLLPKRSK